MGKGDNRLRVGRAIVCESVGSVCRWGAVASGWKVEGGKEQERLVGWHGNGN